MEAVKTPPTQAAIDDVVRARQAIKDIRTVKRHAWEAEDADLEADQNRLDSYLLERLNALGASSVATDHGTAYRSLRIKPSAADWGAIWEWMKKNDAAELLERRLKSGFIKDYMEEHDGALPPGINVHREYVVAVRRPTKTPESGGDQ